jgi:16S rRNA C967 or C1407 C5-methylase (RsmB/RsmF family)
MAKISFHEFIASLLPSEEVQDFFATCTKYLPKTIYPLYHKNPVSDIEFVATKNKRNLTPFTNISPSRMYTLQGESAHHEVGSHLIHELGLCYVQEGAASVPAQLLNPQEGELILDMCAAPGGKTVQLADALLQTENPGIVIANEPDPLRRNALIANCKRTGLRNTVIT